ncbi:MAG: transporter related protein [Micavibrio sp.]|nr:transporter related protein [Micavibrio sp.]
MTKNVTYKDIGGFSLHYWGRRWKMGVGAIALMFVAVATDIVLPVYVGRSVDALTRVPGDNETAIGAFVVFAVLGFAYPPIRSASMFLWNAFAVNTMYDLVSDAMRKVQRFSSDWHANAFAGATVRKITRGMWAFDVFEDTWFMGLFPAVVMMIGMTGMLAMHVPVIGGYAAFCIVVYCAFSVISSLKILAPRFRYSAAADTKMGAVLADIITGNPTVKAFGAEGREDMVFDAAAVNWRRRSFAAWQTAQATDFARTMMRMVMMVGMFGLAIWMCIHGRASAGDTVLVLTSFFIVGGYMRDVGMHISNLQRSASEMEDVVHFWLREDEVRDSVAAKPLATKDGGIVFDRVTFGYQGQTKPVFSDFSLVINPGEKIALVGPSGSGKSTFVKLVQRLYDVQDGEIRIDGQNIAAVTQESLRQAIALVPQDPVLFHRSLAENIAYGRPGASPDEIRQAAAEAYADDFIGNLPLKYETLVGERGVKLSGGERQRVAIARALLADAPVLILDEATSNLDSISEHYIQKALDNLMRGKTTITVAHRLATIRRADRILVFEHGRIVEQGTHQDLVHNHMSHYKKLYDMQALDLVG